MVFIRLRLVVWESMERRRRDWQSERSPLGATDVYNDRPKSWIIY